MGVPASDLAGAEQIIEVPALGSAPQRVSRYFSAVLTSRWQLLIGAFLLANALVFLALLHVPAVSRVQTQLKDVGAVVFTILCVIGALPFMAASLREAWSAWNSQEIRPELCTVLVIGGLAFSLVYGIVEDFEQVSSSLFYAAPIAVLFFLSLEKVAWELLSDQMEKMLGFPYCRNRLTDGFWTRLSAGSGAEEKVSAGEISEGDIIGLKESEYAPCDVTVLDGSAEIVDGALPGLARRRFVEQGDAFCGGARIISGELTVRSLATWAESDVSDLSALYEESLIGDGRFLNRLGVIATAVMCAILFLAACAGIYRYRAQEGMVVVAGVVSACLAVGVLLRVSGLLLLLRRVMVASLYRAGIIAADASALSRFARIRSIVVKYDHADPPGACAVEGYHVLDSRIDLKQLTALAAYLLSKSADAQHLELAGYLRREKGELKKFPASEYRVYPGAGLCAVVQGAEISIGTEEFLLARGVFLQPSDVGPSSTGTYIYVAVNDQLAARYELGAPFAAEGRALRSAAQKFGLRMILWSEAAGSGLDKAGKELGLELSNVRENIPVRDFDHHFSAARPLLVSSHGVFDIRRLGDHDLSCSRFDRMRWNLRESDLVLLRGRPALLAPVMTLVRSGMQLRRLITAVFAGLGLLAFGVALADGVSAPVTIGILVSFLGLAYGSTYLYGLFWLKKFLPET